MIPIDHILLATAVLLLTGILASRASSRLGVPALLLFLLIGMFAGSEGLGGIPYDDPSSAQFVGVLALAFILFSGGLETERRSIELVAWQGLSLATIGVVITAALISWFSMLVLSFSWLEGLLLGAIVSSTDAAAVFSVMRSQRIGLEGATQPLLEVESGSNDPMAVFLTTAVLGLLTGTETSIHGLLGAFVLQMVLGAVLGVLAGKGTMYFINHLKLESEGLYPVATLAAVLLTYSGTAMLGGSGFLAVYVAGVVMGNADFLHKRSLKRFHDGIAWLMQMIMFLVLGLLVFPSRLVPIAGVGLLLSIFLIVVARPIAVMTSLLFARLQFRQKVLISWVGLRGAVPIVLATFPYMAGLPKADLYFNVVFFIVLSSVLLQGTTIARATRLLGLETPMTVRRQYPLEFVPGTKSESEMVELNVPPYSPAIGRRLMDLRLPKSALVVLISRGEEFVAPRGATSLLANDTLLVLASKDDVEGIRSILAVPDTLASKS